MGKDSLPSYQNSVSRVEDNLREQILLAIKVLTEQVTDNQSRNVLLELITNQLINLTGATSTFVHLVEFDGQNSYLRLAAVAGEFVTPVGQVLQPDEGMAGAALASGSVQYIGDYNQFGKRLNHIISVKQACAIPMIAAGDIIGIVGIMFSIDCASIESQLDILKQFSSIAGIAIRNSQLLRQTRVELKQANALVELAESLARSNSISELAEVAATSAITGFQVTEFSLWSVKRQMINGNFGAWRSVAHQPVALTESEIEVLMQNLSAESCVQAALLSGYSNVQFINLPYIDLQQGPDKVCFLLIDSGRAWGVLQLVCEKQYISNALSSSNVARSAAIQIALAARMHKLLNNATLLATRDPLTNAQNRLSFEKYLKEKIKKHRVGGCDFGLLFIDLDGFKQINDSLGHNEGDALLKQIALRLDRILAKSQQLFRLGGDEFSVVVDLLKPDDCEKVAANVLAELSAQFDLSTSIQIGASIGISYCQGPGDTAENLVERADRAMYLAKREGKNKYRVSVGGHNFNASLLNAG